MTITKNSIYIHDGLSVTLAGMEGEHYILFVTFGRGLAFLDIPFQQSAISGQGCPEKTQLSLDGESASFAAA